MLGSPLDSGLNAGLGSGTATARDYFSRALFGFGSAQGPARGWFGARLGMRLGLAWPSSGSVSEIDFTRSRLGSKLGSAQISSGLGNRFGILIAYFEA